MRAHQGQATPGRAGSWEYLAQNLLLVEVFERLCRRGPGQDYRIDAFDLLVYFGVVRMAVVEVVIVVVLAKLLLLDFYLVFRRVDDIVVRNHLAPSSKCQSMGLSRQKIKRKRGRDAANEALGCATEVSWDR